MIGLKLADTINALWYLYFFEKYLSLAGIVVAEIATGGAITAALPVIINAITTAMNAAMVVSIIDTIAKAAGYIETYLTQGWARHIQPAAIALATALAMGLVELAMALGFKFAEKGIKATAGGAKKLKRPDRQDVKQIQVQKVQNREKRPAYTNIRGGQSVGTAV